MDFIPRILGKLRYISVLMIAKMLCTIKKLQEKAELPKFHENEQIVPEFSE